MIFTSIRLSVSYGQIAVFDSAFEHPFHNWTDTHFEQGFCWRPGSVCFRVLDEGGKFTVEIAVADSAEISPEAIRVIATPFEVLPTGSIEIASISDNVPVNVPPGMYSLRFECFPNLSAWEGKVRLVFARNDNPSFKILRADAAITAREHLLTSATPF
jgi:Competence protein J (ComJ)